MKPTTISPKETARPSLPKLEPSREGYGFLNTILFMPKYPSMHALAFLSHSQKELNR